MAETGDVPTDQVAGYCPWSQEFVVKAGPASSYRAFPQAINDGKTPQGYARSALPVLQRELAACADELSGSGWGLRRCIGDSSSAPVINVINNTGSATFNRDKGKAPVGPRSQTSLLAPL